MFFPVKESSYHRGGRKYLEIRRKLLLQMCTLRLGCLGWWSSCRIYTSPKNHLNRRVLACFADGQVYNFSLSYRSLSQFRAVVGSSDGGFEGSEAMKASGMPQEALHQGWISLRHLLDVLLGVLFHEHAHFCIWLSDGE